MSKDTEILNDFICFIAVQEKYGVIEPDDATRLYDGAQKLFEEGNLTYQSAIDLEDQVFGGWENHPLRGFEFPPEAFPKPKLQTYPDDVGAAIDHFHGKHDPNIVPRDWFDNRSDPVPSPCGMKMM